MSFFSDFQRRKKQQEQPKKAPDHHSSSGIPSHTAPNLTGPRRIYSKNYTPEPPKNYAPAAPYQPSYTPSYHQNYSDTQQSKNTFHYYNKDDMNRQIYGEAPKYSTKTQKAEFYRQSREVTKRSYFKKNGLDWNDQSAHVRVDRMLDTGYTKQNANYEYAKAKMSDLEKANSTGFSQTFFQEGKDAQKFYSDTYAPKKEALAKQQKADEAKRAQAFNNGKFDNKTLKGIQERAGKSSMDKQIATETAKHLREAGRVDDAKKIEHALGIKGNWLEDKLNLDPSQKGYQQAFDLLGRFGNATGGNFLEQMSTLDKLNRKNTKENGGQLDKTTQLKDIASVIGEMAKQAPKALAGTAEKGYGDNVVKKTALAAQGIQEKDLTKAQKIALGTLDFGAEVLGDPSVYMTGGLNALSKAGKLKALAEGATQAEKLAGRSQQIGAKTASTIMDPIAPLLGLGAKGVTKGVQGVNALIGDTKLGNSTKNVRDRVLEGNYAGGTEQVVDGKLARTKDGVLNDILANARYDKNHVMMNFQETYNRVLDLFKTDGMTAKQQKEIGDKYGSAIESFLIQTPNTYNTTSKMKMPNGVEVPVHETKVAGYEGHNSEKVIDQHQVLSDTLDSLTAQRNQIDEASQGIYEQIKAYRGVQLPNGMREQQQVYRDLLQHVNDQIKTVQGHMSSLDPVAHQAELQASDELASALVHDAGTAEQGLKDIKAQYPNFPKRPVPTHSQVIHPMLNPNIYDSTVIQNKIKELTAQAKKLYVAKDVEGFNAIKEEVKRWKDLSEKATTPIFKNIPADKNANVPEDLTAQFNSLKADAMKNETATQQIERKLEKINSIKDLAERNQKIMGVYRKVDIKDLKTDKQKTMKATQMWHDSNKEMVGKLKDLGINMEMIDGYMFHMLTKEGQAVIEKSKKLQDLYGIDLKDVNKVKEGFLKGRKNKGSVQDINSSAGLAMFNNNAFLNNAKTIENIGHLVYSHKVAKEVFDHPNLTSKTPIEGTVPIDIRDYNYLTKGSEPIRKLLASEGVSTETELFRKYQVKSMREMPDEMFTRYVPKNLQRGLKVNATPQEFKSTFRKFIEDSSYTAPYRLLTNQFKKMATATSGTVIRNFLGGMFQNYAYGLTDAKYTTDAMKDVMGILKNKKSLWNGEIKHHSDLPIRFQKMLEHGAGETNINSYSDRSRLKLNQGDNKQLEKITNRVTDKISKPFHAWNSLGDYTNRYALFNSEVDKLVKKGTAEEDAYKQAAQTVRETHFSNDKLSEWEKGVANFVPFYEWNRHILPFLFQTAEKNPHAFTNTLKLQDKSLQSAGVDNENDQRKTDQGAGIGFGLPMLDAQTNLSLPLDLNNNPLVKLARQAIAGRKDGQMDSYANPLAEALVQNIIKGKNVYGYAIGDTNGMTEPYVNDYGQVKERASTALSTTLDERVKTALQTTIPQMSRWAAGKSESTHEAVKRVLGFNFVKNQLPDAKRLENRVKSQESKNREAQAVMKEILGVSVSNFQMKKDQEAQLTREMGKILNDYNVQDTPQYAHLEKRVNDAKPQLLTGKPWAGTNPNSPYARFYNAISNAYGGDVAKYAHDKKMFKEYEGMKAEQKQAWDKYQQGKTYLEYFMGEIDNGKNPKDWGGYIETRQKGSADLKKQFKVADTKDLPKQFKDDKFLNEFDRYFIKKEGKKPYYSDFNNRFYKHVKYKQFKK